MSGYLAGKIWRSDLAVDLKPFAAVLADVANDDGSHIYPSIGYLCWLTGRSERAIRGWLSELRALKVIRLVGEVTDPLKLGRGYGAEYEMVVENLPKRPKWIGPQSLKSHATVAGVLKRKPCKRRHKALQNAASSLCTDPSVDPSVRTDQDPVQETPSFCNPKHPHRHQQFFCSEYMECVSMDQHFRFTKRVQSAGLDPEDLDWPAWYRDRDQEWGGLALEDRESKGSTFWLAVRLGAEIDTLRKEGRS